MNESTINPELMYESAEWRSADDAKKAYAEGGSAITSVTMTDCKMAGGTLCLYKDTTIYDGHFGDLSVGTPFFFARSNITLVFSGAYANSIHVETDAVASISSDNYGDYAHVNSLLVCGQANLGDADIVFLTVDRTGYARVQKTAEVGNLEVYGTVDLQSIHVKHITLHAGGKILSKYPFDLSTIVTDEGRKPYVDKDGWICG